VVTPTTVPSPSPTPVDVPLVPGAGGPGGALPWTLLAALAALAGLILWARRSAD